MRTIDKQCPGDCSKCTFPQEIPNFDFYGCVLHQIFQKTIKLERDHAELARMVYDNLGNNEKEQTFTNEHKMEDLNYGTSNEILPEQERKE